MAFSLRITRYVVVLLISLGWLSWTRAVSIKCGKCEQSRCPELHYCQEEVIKDNCGCCNVCSSARNQPHLLPAVNDESREGGACRQVKCPKFKVCVENMQGLPLCTCPGPFICKGRARQRRMVCGTDGVTYQSRCYLRIAACNSAARIRVAHKGPCSENDRTSTSAAKPRQCPSSSTCRKRKKSRPVCGTDGKTYISRCHMKIAACQREVKIRLKNLGICRTTSAPASSSTDQRVGTRRPTTDASVVADKGSDVRGRKGRKKKVGNDVTGSDVEKKKRRKQRRDKRKNKKERRRRRRKTRGKSRSRRYDANRYRLQKKYNRLN